MKDAQVNKILEKHRYNYLRLTEPNVKQNFRLCIQNIIGSLPQTDRRRYHAKLQWDSTAHTQEQRRNERVSMAFNKLAVLRKLIREYKTSEKYTVIVKEKSTGKEIHNPYIKCLEAIEELQKIPKKKAT